MSPDPSAAPDETDGGPVLPLTEVEAAFAMGVSSARPFAVEDVPMQLVQHHYRLHSFEHLRSTPARPRGETIFEDAASFASFVAEIGDQHTRLYASRTEGTLTAIFDDHLPGQSGRREYRARLDLQPGPDWQVLKRINNQFLAQPRFLEILEELAPLITQPDAADLVELCMNMRGMKRIE